MSHEPEHPDLTALRRVLEHEEEAYAAALDALDRLAASALPEERLNELGDQRIALNTLWSRLPPPEGGGWAGGARKAWDALAPALDRQAQFNACVVQILNGSLEQTALLHTRLREIVSTLLRYLQCVLPVMDARDRVSGALATTRAELILESFDRRQEALARRVEGLGAMRDRLETVSEQVRGVSSALESTAIEPARLAAAQRVGRDSVYAAFENRFRGSPEEIRDRLMVYLPLLAASAPVVDLGCGRGEMLDLLHEQGVDASGVESNAHLTRECRARGLNVSEGDLLAFLAAKSEGSIGAVFAAQVAEHLPPDALVELLQQSHRVLRRGGQLILETVNPRSVVGFLEVYNRDLTHERPLHPDTLKFLAAAAGFCEARIEWRAPVDPASRLQPVLPDGLPQRAAQTLNENIARLNDLLYGPQEYALIATR